MSLGSRVPVFCRKRFAEFSIIAVISIITVLSTPSALAEDSSGKFAIKGAGVLPCQVFVAERAKRSDVFRLAAGWVEGYVSAYNRFTPDTFDIASFESSELLLSIVQKHCEGHPQDRLHAVLHSMLTALHPDRLSVEAERIHLKDGERATMLYRETIRRMQAELARRGLYRGAADGRFTDETRSALIAFQTDLKFEATGFPDQLTLWRLLRK